jgi:hypothetical protein
MPARSREAHSSLFTVRMWPEEIEEGRVEWRGKVQNVLSGETRYFREWDALSAFIRSSIHQEIGELGGESVPAEGAAQDKGAKRGPDK